VLVKKYCLISLDEDDYNYGVAVATTSAHEVVEDKTTKAIHTDNNGRATFTVQLGPKSDVGRDEATEACILAPCTVLYQVT
jgi:hypothetical protein